MAYIAGHSAFIAYALETGTITESTDGITPAALPAIPTSPVLIGYTNVPEATLNLGNKKGFAIGDSRALYDSKGTQMYEISFELRLGAFAFLQQCMRQPGSEVLPRIAIFVGVKGQFTDVYRFCACDNLALAFQEGDAKELTATVRFKGIARQSGSVMNPSPSQIKALGSPLLWHNVRQLTIAGTSYRQALMGFNASLANNLENKGVRPDWGDLEPCSRTVYDLLPHMVNVSGDATFHSRLDPALINGAINAQRWGDVVISASDSAAIPGGQTAQNYTVTLKNVVPVTATQSGVEASAQMNFRCNVLADDIVVALA